MGWEARGSIRGPATSDPFPSYSGVTSGRFDGPGSTFNWKASNTRRMRAALMNAQAESDRCRIVWIGDSSTAGYGVTVGVEDTPSVVRRMLTGSGYRVGEIVQFINNDNRDQRYNYGGTWSVGPKYYPWMQGGSGGWINYTSSVPGTKLYIVCGDVPDAVFTYAIDGGAPVTVNPTGGPVSSRVVEVSGLSDGFHNVVITSGGISYLAAIGVGYGNTLELMNGGISQSTAQEWQLGAMEFGPNSIAAAVSPDVVFINVGANDFGNSGTSVAQIRTYLTNIITQFSATADCVLMVPSWPDRPNFDQFFAGLYATAIQHDIPLIDVSNALGDNATADALGLFQADGLHLTAPGTAAVAALQYSALEKVGLVAADQKAFVPKVGNSTVYGDITLNGKVAPRDGVALTNGTFLVTEGATKTNIGFPASDGPTFELFKGNHATRAGEFVAVFGGGTDAGAVNFYHSNAAQTWPRPFYIDGTGPSCNWHVLRELSDPTADHHATPRGWVNTQLAGKVGTGDSRLTDSRTPTAHTHGAADVASGTLDVARVPTGTTGTTVALGNHTHAYAATSHTHGAADVTSGTLDVARLPTGTTGTTVALGNHTHSNYVQITTAQTVTYSASVAIDPTAGKDFKITATGALALSVSTTGAVDGQMVMVEVLASGGARTVTVTATFTTGLVAANAIASGKTGFFGFRYSALVGGWVLLAVTASL